MNTSMKELIVQWFHSNIFALTIRHDGTHTPHEMNPLRVNLGNLWGIYLFSSQGRLLCPDEVFLVYFLFFVLYHLGASVFLVQSPAFLFKKNSLYCLLVS